MMSDIQIVHDDTMDFVNRAMFQHDPLALAACLTSIGFSIYRTSLNEEDYQIMVKSIFDNRGKIKKFL
jgi:hypothetical protein